MERHLNKALVAFSAALATTACWGGESTLEIRPRGSLDDTGSLAGLVLRVEGYQLTAEDFGPDEAGLIEAQIRVPNSGRLQIIVELHQHGRIVAAGEAGWQLRDEYEWGMDVFRQTGDPRETCFGCMGSVQISIDADAQQKSGEALWVVWGGKPKGSDIIF